MVRRLRSGPKNPEMYCLTDAVGSFSTKMLATSPQLHREKGVCRIGNVETFGVLRLRSSQSTRATPLRGCDFLLFESWQVVFKQCEQLQRER